MGFLDTVIDTLTGFNETIFYKEASDLQSRYDVLKQLNEEYPNNYDLLSELYIIKKGLAGENEIAYQLKKSHIGMYVLRDIKVKHEDFTAQIDYVIITPTYDYYIECKNLVGNITVTDKGDFIREFTVNGKKIKKGMYSPLRQVEAQREVLRKIWASDSNTLQKIFGSKYFDYFRRVLVVAANQDTILNTNKAPKDMKYKILRADALVRQIEYDLEHKANNDPHYSKKDMEKAAQYYIDISYNEDINYYDYYKEKFSLTSNNNSPNGIQKNNTNTNSNDNSNDDLREKLIKFRKSRSTEMKIPAYYIFTNDELEKLLEIKPKTLDELKNANILSPVKVKTHGQQIIDELN